MKTKQLKLFKDTPSEFGGEERKGKRKLKRPFSPKAQMHLVLKSKRARGKWNMLAGTNATQIKKLVLEKAKKWGVRIERYVNVGNHIHLLVQAREHRGFKGFLREVSGASAFINPEFWKRTPERLPPKNAPAAMATASPSFVAPT